VSKLRASVHSRAQVSEAAHDGLPHPAKLREIAARKGLLAGVELVDELTEIATLELLSNRPEFGLDFVEGTDSQIVEGRDHRIECLQAFSLFRIEGLPVRHGVVILPRPVDHPCRTPSLPERDELPLAC
jgi:hypothetical protein